MLNVNNKKTLNNLSYKSFKANKFRNLFVVIAIILTCILFTSVFTIGLNVVKSFQYSTMRQTGGSSHATFKDINESEYNDLIKDKSIVQSGYTLILGLATNEELRSRQMEMRYASNEYVAQSFFSYPTVGSLPEKYNEIALDEITLDLLGVEPELGANITLSYELNGETVTDDFVLSGYWEGDRIAHSSQLWLSYDYVNSKIDTLIDGKNNDNIGTIQLNVDYKNSRNIEDKTIKVIENSGYTTNEINYGVNWAYVGNSESVSMSIGCVIIAIMIIACGYLIISNIFYISISNDINFYGLLKTIGVTNRQIKVIIRKQALLLCVIGIPIGLILGYFIGTALTPLLISTLTITSVYYEASIFVFIVSAIFTILTVLLGIKKPANVAGKVSPIEGSRYNDTSNVKIKVRKSKKNSLFNMSLRNVSRNKKKLIVVAMSLSISLVILNSVFSFTKSFDMDKYLQLLIKSDFMVMDVSFGNFTTDFYNRETITPEFLEEINKQDGINHISSIYFNSFNFKIDDTLAKNVNNMLDNANLHEIMIENNKKALSEGEALAQLYGLDEYGFEQLENYEGDKDYDKLKSGNYVVTGYLLDNDEGERYTCYDVGDKVDINGKIYEVLAIADIPYSMSAQFSSWPKFIFSTDEYINITGDHIPMITMIDVDDNYLNEMDSFLDSYCNNVNKNLKYSSKVNLIKEFKNMQSSYLIVGGTLSAIIALIGILNFVNTIATSIISRKTELATLKSIGGTDKQIRKMLILEGVIYMALTYIIVITIGSAISYAAILMITSNAWLLTTYFSVLPSVLCMPFLLLVSIAVPSIFYKFIAKQSIIERLRRD